MAESDNLYIGWELRGKLEQQIKDAIKDALFLPLQRY